MPRLALAICVLWFCSLFVFRTFVHWRKTGSTGFKGFHGRVGSLPWIAGVTTSLGLVLAGLAPLGALFGWPGCGLLVSNPALHLAGACFAGVGLVGALVAQFAMGSSWRIGVDESETTELVTDGVFAWVRNPIFSFVWISVVGLVLIVPSVLSALACLLTVVGIEVQVRAVEEPYLGAAHGEAYTRYSTSVGRFVPGVGLLHG
ncbi:MAG: isoprenylcysteine carboxylmethyltransferase family protein [Myxococcales bacterium]|nr:isoprenylcysteine carboxylmethyltransferase family protein [Myxococcales bacterium]